MSQSKILIAFYSRAGQNIVSGTIENLPVGNTKVAAQFIQNFTGGDMFQIDTVEPYPDDYTETTKVAMAEMKEKARPELIGDLPDTNKYDIMFLGYPNWWGTMPMAVFTFLENCDFSGMKIVPFCTHEGSGLGRSEGDIGKLCPGAEVLMGLDLRGGRIQRSEQDIQKWIKKVSVLKE